MNPNKNAAIAVALISAFAVLGSVLMALVPTASALGDCKTSNTTTPTYSSNSTQCTVRYDGNGLCIGYYYNEFTNEHGSSTTETCDKYIDPTS